MSHRTTTLFRPIGPEELALLEKSDFLRWPPRLPDQPIFYPVTNEAYAREIAERRNVPASDSGYVTRFEINSDWLAQFDPQVVGAARHTEYWIPAERLQEMNDQISGHIEVIAKFPTTEKE